MAVYNGAKWGGSPANGTSGGVVTWSFATLSGYFYQFDRVITEASYQALVRAAFQAWEDVANIDFVEQRDAADVDIRLGWDAIDGPYGAVGTTSWQMSTTMIRAEIRFDTAEQWSANAQVNIPGSVNFYATALHEIGHAIGLGHNSDPQSVMYAYVNAQTQLTADDIAGIRALYGPAQSADVALRGTPGNDNLVGTSRNENILGLGGNDLLRGAGGDDFIDGGPGIDRAQYATFRSQYFVDVDPNGGVMVRDLRSGSPEGSDQLVAVERLVFADGVLAVDIDGNAGDAYRLYQASFDRTPDLPGLRFWVQKSDEGMGQIEMAARFIDSNEFRTLYGADPGREEFIGLLYANVLDRAPDTSGFNYWNGQMARGMSEAEVLARFSDSPENQQQVIGQIDNGIWLGA